MLDHDKKQGFKPAGAIEFRKGCPACENTDPQLDRELQAFAQLLFDIYISKRAKRQEGGKATTIDNRS